MLGFVHPKTDCLNIIHIELLYVPVKHGCSI